MLVLVATSNGQRFKSDRFECAENEIVRFGILQTKNNLTGKEITMKGITTGKESTTVKAVELDIDEEFFYELVKESIEQEGLEVGDDGVFVVKSSLSSLKFNLKESVQSLIKLAQEQTEGKTLRVHGRMLREDNVADEKPLSTRRKINRSLKAKRNERKSESDQGFAV